MVGSWPYWFSGGHFMGAMYGRISLLFLTNDPGGGAFDLGAVFVEVRGTQRLTRDNCATFFTDTLPVAR